MVHVQNQWQVAMQKRKISYYPEVFIHSLCLHPLAVIPISASCTDEDAYSGKENHVTMLLFRLIM